MDIMFLWDSRINNDNDDGVMLSGKYIIKCDMKKGILSIKRNNDYVHGFWGKNVQDCFAIVGDNGAGKTVLVNYIMDNLSTIKDHTESRNDFLLICQNLGTGKLYIYKTSRFANIEIQVQSGIQFEIVSGRNIFLDRLEVVYFHNTLNMNDYSAYFRCKYDFSIGKMISRHHRTTYEMHYDDFNIDIINNYFYNEDFRIISFLYDYAIHNELNIEFPVPRSISIHVVDGYFNEEYIMREAKEIRANSDEEKLLDGEALEFKLGLSNIVNVFGPTWINYTIKNMILNCFKELCISTTVPDNTKMNHRMFFNACRFLNNTDEISELDVYQCAYNLISSLRTAFSNEKYLNIDCIDSVEEFVGWLKTNEEDIEKFEKKAFCQLDIPTDKSTEKFITGLVRLYSKLNFQFPFYDFSFGVSSGEYLFLSIFSNLYSIVKGDSNGIKVYDYSKMEPKTNSMLIILDEADLSMHPKWQRMYMKWVTDFCEQLFKDVFIKIIVTTHSPILLSDFPANSVLYLRRKNGRTIYSKQEEKETFGCNIHSLFLDSFFLEEYGTMGAFAEEKINGIAEMLLKKNRGEINFKETEKIIRYIGEGIIKEKLERALNNRQEKKSFKLTEAENTVIHDMLYKLKEQRDHLEQLIKELEEKTNDKN